MACVKGMFTTLLTEHADVVRVSWKPQKFSMSLVVVLFFFVVDPRLSLFLCFAMLCKSSHATVFS